MTKTPTITERLHEVLPEIQEQKRIAEQLRQYRHQGITASTQLGDKAFEQVEAHVLELILAGQDVPADVARPILEARQRDEMATLRSTILSRLARSAERSGQSAMTTNAEDTTAFLRTELSRVLAEVRELAPDLAGITSADKAIAAGPAAITAWQRATKCAQDYDEIRQLQFDLAKSLTDDLTTEKFLRTGILADAIDVQGVWVNRRRRNAIAEKNGGPVAGAGAKYEKWLTTALPKRTFDYKSDWWQDGESHVEHMLRLVKDATPWLPSVEDFEDALKYALDATEQVTTDTPQQWEVARRSYYNLTGARPKVQLPEAPTFVRNTAPYSQPAKLTKKISDAKERSFAENARSALGLGETHD